MKEEKGPLEPNADMLHLSYADIYWALAILLDMRWEDNPLGMHSRTDRHFKPIWNIGNNRKFAANKIRTQDLCLQSSKHTNVLIALSHKISVYINIINGIRRAMKTLPKIISFLAPALWEPRTLSLTLQSFP